MANTIPVNFSGMSSWFDPVSDYFSGYTSQKHQDSFNAQSQMREYLYNRALMDHANEFSADQSAKAFDRTIEAYNLQMADYRRRYQDVVNDLRQANINPLLAVLGSGFQVGNTPSTTSFPSPVSSNSNVSGHSVGSNVIDPINGITSAVGAVSSLAQLGGMIANRSADTALKQTASAKNVSETALNEAKTAQTIADTQKPGVIGQASSSIINSAKEWGKNSLELLSNIKDSFARNPENAASSARSAAQKKEAEEVLSKQLYEAQRQAESAELQRLEKIRNKPIKRSKDDERHSSRFLHRPHYD